MKFWHALTLSACLPFAANTALAQGAYPNLLPLPQVTAPAGYYPLASVPEANAGYGQMTPVAAYSPVAEPVAPPAEFDPDRLWTDEPPPMPGAYNGSGCSTLYSPTYDSPLAGCDDCGCYDSCCQPCRSPWFGSVYGLIMTRDRGNKLWTTYETNNNPNQLMHTQDADSDWAGGAGITIGRCFGCNHGIEVSYWALDTMEGYASLRDLNNNLSTPLDLQTSQIGPDLTSYFFDNSREHRLWRYSDFQNLEINLLRFPVVQTSRTSITWMAGVRWFRFDEGLIFGASSFGNDFGTAGGIEEAYLNIDVENNLIGGQVGARANWAVGERFSLFATPKFGVYGNDIDVRSQLYRGDGLVGFDLPASKTDVALLGSLDLGGQFYITPRWSIFGGYRVVGATGVALADNQIPHYMVAADEFVDIDSNGSVILHGAFAGLQFNY